MGLLLPEQTSQTMQLPALSRIPGRSFLACALTASAATVLCAQDNNSAEADAPAPSPVQLDHYVVSATRVPTDPSATPSAVTVLDLDHLEAIQTPDLATAIGRTPGLSISRTGAFGGPVTIFMRGAGNDHTLFLVDGIRMNTGDASYNNFLGGAGYDGFGRIEVLSGPQSTLYGSSALGGVIVMDTTAGCGPTSGSVATTVGSFGTYGASTEVQGGVGATGYSASLSGFSTQNKREFNDYEALSYSTRVETMLTPAVLVGFTLRGQVSEAGSPGSLTFVSPADVDTTTHLATVYAEVSPVESFSSRLTYGWVQREYDYTPKPPPLGNAFDSPFYSRDTRNVIDWQNSWETTEWLSFVAGTTVEFEDVRSSGTEFENDSQGGYLTASLHPGDSLVILGGIRYENYDQFGDAVTWKTGVSYLVEPTRTKLRANYGTGFNAPRPVYVVGDGGVFYNPNPTLKPEESTGWDIGFDQVIFPDRATLGVTYFNNDFTNLFVYDFTIPGILNTGKASSEGVEVALNLTPVKDVVIDIAYTWLEANNDSAGVQLIRRPRHVFSGDVAWQATKEWLVGAGLNFSSRRYDGSSTAPVRVEDYTTVRLFTQYQVTKDITVKFRVENLLDEEYQEVRNYPSLPLAAYGTVVWHF